MVTPGAPAHVAGIEVGESINSINSEPVLNPEDLQNILLRIDAGETVALEVRSADGTMRTVQVETTYKPLELVRPATPEMLSEGQDERRGFQFSLKQQTMGEWPDLDRGMRTRNWQARRVEGAETETVEFLYELPQLEDGRRFAVVKRYSLPSEPGAYHVNLEIEIRNLGSEPAAVSWELWGPAGLPTEGWWYQQKIHGNTWAIGRMAGARDILVSTVGRPYRFFSGPQVVTDRQNGAHGSVLIERGQSDAEQRSIRYLALDTLYFTSALQPVDAPLECYSAYGSVVSKIPDDSKQRSLRLTDINYVIYSPEINVEPWKAETGSGGWKQSFRIFAGPKEPPILERYGLEDARTFGWFAAFSRPLMWLLHVLHTVTFGVSYGLAIILLTVIVRTLMIPISRKAAMNAQMMQHLTPEIKEIAEKYKDQPEKRVKAQQELFARYNYNPFGGCLLMFLQLPIFIGLYRGLSVDVALRDAPLIPGMEWGSNLAGPDQMFYWKDWMPSFLADETGWLGPWFNLLPVVTIALMLVQQKMFMPPATDDQTRMTQRMLKIMMIFMGFLFFKVAAGLCVYFIASSIWGIVERKLLPKPQLDVARFEARASRPKGGLLRGLLQQQEQPESATGSLTNTKALEARRQRERDRKRKMRERP
jgi:YidC/Oxa1 family membrane protein insertase